MDERREAAGRRGCEVSAKHDDSPDPKPVHVERRERAVRADRDALVDDCREAVSLWLTGPFAGSVELNSVLGRMRMRLARIDSPR
jgi:hypothetical protein